MDRLQLIRAVAGGYIDEYTFDMRRNRVTLAVSVLEHGALSHYELVYDQVSFFSFETDSRASGGERLELTQMWIDEAPEASASEEWRFTISIWDTSHISIKCSLVSVDDVVVR